MNKLEGLLHRGRNGNAVLFCGAGLTADSLNFEDQNILGVTSHLLGLLNNGLKAAGKPSDFKNIRNAANRFKQDLGNRRLMQLLKDRFRLSAVSASIVDIVSYPWATIYTTNYDNGLEIALQRAGKKSTSLNNLDDPNWKSSGTPVIHLHGYAEAWTDQIFEQSCVLDADSYRHLTAVRGWLERLRLDIERAEIVVFIGFSASDVHLENIFFNSTGLKEKAFFINRPVAEPDQDERAIQEGFGVPLYIGRENFATRVTEAIRREAPKEPALASFDRFQSIEPSDAVPPVRDIEDLFIWGKVVHEHVKRDCDQSKSDYHIQRQIVRRIQNLLSEKGRVILLSGDICDGKSLVILGAINGLVGARQVFVLRHPYDDLLSETASILSIYPNAVFVVENCFGIRDDRLLGMARQVAASDGSLILSARSISTEAEGGKLGGLRAIASFLELEVGKLEPDEIDSLITLIDQIAGWRNISTLSISDRRRFIERDCQGAIPNVLLRLLNSDYVRTRYREEYQKTNFFDPQERRMVVAALLISNIGFDAPLAFISNVFEKDFRLVLKKISNQSGELRLVRAVGLTVQTVPSIGARNLLRNIIEDREIVNTVIEMLEKMAADVSRNDFQSHIFSQLMRYSILNSVVEDADEVNRFFDHISKIAYFRTIPLFWLQWHMAMCAQQRWLDAEKYLDMGDTAADAYERKYSKIYNRRQLDDRRAKFLAARASSIKRSSAELFKDLKGALDIAGRLLRDTDLTHHPYETLRDILQVLNEKEGIIEAGLRGILFKQAVIVAEYAQKKIGNVVEGYQRNHAKEAINKIEVILSTRRQ